jgi:hypothetical protein
VTALLQQDHQQAPLETSRPGSPSEYAAAAHQYHHQQDQPQQQKGAGPLSHLPPPSQSHITRVYSVVLPAVVEAEAAQGRHPLQQQVGEQPSRCGCWALCRCWQLFSQ